MLYIIGRVNNHIFEVFDSTSNEITFKDRDCILLENNVCGLENGQFNFTKCCRKTIAFFAKNKLLGNKLRTQTLTPDNFNSIMDSSFNISNIFVSPLFSERVSSILFSECKSHGSRKYLNVNSVCIPLFTKIISRGCFDWFTNLEIVYLPIGLTDIEDLAFLNCKNLKYVYIPSSVERIGEHAFSGCLLAKFNDDCKFNISDFR